MSVTEARATGRLTPIRVFRTVAVAEACTWAGLLVGMFLKHVTHTTELGVRIGGMLHGVAFLAFCLVTLVVGIDQGWSKRRTLTGLASAIPPFFTIWFDRNAEKHGLLDDHWHSSPETSTTTAQRVVCWLLRNHRQAIVLFVVALAALTALALVVGPPGS